MIEALELPEAAALVLLAFQNGTQGDAPSAGRVVSVGTLLDLIRKHGRALTDALGLTPDA